MSHGTCPEVFKQLIAFTILAINFQSVALLLGIASVSASPHAAGTGRSAALKQNTISGFYLLDRPRVKCVDGALPSRVRQAKIIFTGTVRHLVVSSIVSRNQMTVETKTVASVEVKRVIKGQDLLDRKLAAFGYSNHGNRIAASDKTLVSVLGLNAPGGSVGYSVGVAPAGIKAGSAAPVICHTTVKVNDTWIFLTNPVDTVPAIGSGRRHGNNVDDDLADFPPVVTLRLNSSLVRLSLNNILLAEAAVNGNHHVINTVSSSASCKHKICPFGAECVADDRGTATCRCVDSCNDTVDGEMTSLSPSSSPVCGTDGVTYSNECELRVVSCQQSRRIGIRWHGTCEARDPCAVKRCQFGARCVVADDNAETAYCKCPSAEECNESDDKEKNSDVVCGSDDVDYVDECHMNVTSCQEQREIKVKFSGKCYPCRGVECPVNHICKLNDKREPVCRCNDDVMQCRTARYSPVCGTDDNTYPNECLLNIESCRQQIPIGVHYVGPCNEELQNSVLLERCANMKCQYYATCQYVNEYDDIITPGSEVIDLEGENVDVRCVCPISCHDVNDSEPVCGTDSVTYDNECQLQSTSCHNGLQIDVLSRGPCELCETVQCPYGAMCHSGLCVCPTPQSCPTRDDPICANDSLTYQNECVMRSVACNLAIELYPLHHGECYEDEDTQQSSGLEDMTYCDDTNCKFGGICYSSSSDDRYRCVCFMNCDDNESARAEVCGSDGTIYNNDCALREAACLMQTYIDILPTERCTDGSLATSDNCRDTEFGCCADEVTTALGPNMAGCPHVCRCNPLGSRSPQCDPATGQCPCKHGVGGIRCNRCRPGYWGLALAANQQLSGNGCTPCRCSPFGSLRDDCDQMTGRCVCRSHVTGLKCNVCSIDGSQLQSAADCIQTASASAAAGAVTSSESFPTIDNGILPEADITLLTTLTPATMKTSTNPVTASNFVTVQQNVTLRLNVAEMHTPATVTSTSAASVTTTTDVMRHSDAFTVPSFSHRSYVELSPLDHGQREIIVEINFKTYAVNGILFYTGRNIDNIGHFMSLAIKDGYLEFRYDLGSGPRALRAKEKVSLNKFHKAVAKRFGRDGMLRLDNGKEVSGVSPGTRNSLESNTSVYLGYPANATERTFKNVGVHEGLKGCIESLRIASPTLNKEYELTMPGSSDITKAYGIDECDVLPCDKVNCLNGGACMFDENNGVYGCQCIDNYSGNHCEIKPESTQSSNHNAV